MSGYHIPSEGISSYLSGHKLEWARSAVIAGIIFLPLYRWTLFHEESWTLFIQLAIPLYFILAVGFSWYTRTVSWAGGLGIITGVAFGVIVDVAFNYFIMGGTRNLFPFEIAVVWAIIILPVLVGVYVGYWIALKWRQQLPPA
jgi:hypothetical protein